MRDYQAKSNQGGAADSITATKFGGGEFTSLSTESKNAVSRAGLTLAPANGAGEDTTQLAQSLFLHGVKSGSFQVGGTVDAITLTPVSGASGVVIPADYDNIEGAVITFVPSGPNTGAVTVSIGQTSGTQLGTKKLLDSSGAELSAGELSASRIEAYYDPTADSSSGAWILTPWSEESSTAGLAVAYVNFQGNGTAAINNSYGIDSLVDNGTGDYTINLTDAMSDAEFIVTSGGRRNTTLGTPNYGWSERVHVIDASTIDVYTSDNASSSEDWARIYLTVHGDKA